MWSIKAQGPEVLKLWPISKFNFYFQKVKGQGHIFGMFQEVKGQVSRFSSSKVKTNVEICNYYLIIFKSWLKVKIKVMYFCIFEMRFQHWGRYEISKLQKLIL